MAVNGLAAVAHKVTLVPARNTSPGEGIVRATRISLSTVILTDAEVPFSPVASLAVALKVQLPAGTLLQTMLCDALELTPSKGRNSRYRGDNPELSEARGKE